LNQGSKIVTKEECYICLSFFSSNKTSWPQCANTLSEESMTQSARKVLYVDVTATWRSDAQTGIQRVVRQLVTSWSQLNTDIRLIVFQKGEYKVLPTLALSIFTDLYSVRIPKSYRLRKLVFDLLLPIYLKLKKIAPQRLLSYLLSQPKLNSARRALNKAWIPKNSMRFNPDDSDVLLLDLVFNPDNIVYLKKIALERGTNLTYFSYDCNPLIAPEYWPKKSYEEFLNYISLVYSSKRVWSISKTAQDDIKRFSKVDQSEIFFNFKWLPPTKFPDCNHQNIIFPELENQNYILMVASYVPSKNHLGFLDALEQLHFQGVTIPKVYLVGGLSWISSVIDDKITELLRAGIQITKYEDIANCCLGALYASCVFSILPSFIEGFGLPIVESLSFGKPVVTSTSMSMGELLSLPGTIGFGHNHEPNLVAILQDLMSSKKLLNELTVEADKNSNNLGSWEEYAEQLYGFATRDNRSYGKT